MFYKKRCFWKFGKIHEKTPVSESLFDQVCNFVEKWLQHRVFPLNFAKILRTSILKNILKRLLLHKANQGLEKCSLLIFYYMCMHTHLIYANLGRDIKFKKLWTEQKSASRALNRNIYFEHTAKKLLLKFFSSQKTFYTFSGWCSCVTDLLNVHQSISFHISILCINLNLMLLHFHFLRVLQKQQKNIQKPFQIRF